MREIPDLVLEAPALIGFHELDGRLAVEQDAMSKGEAGGNLGRDGVTVDRKIRTVASTSHLTKSGIHYPQIDQGDEHVRLPLAAEVRHGVVAIAIEVGGKVLDSV